MPNKHLCSSDVRPRAGLLQLHDVLHQLRVQLVADQFGPAPPPAAQVCPAPIRTVLPHLPNVLHPRIIPLLIVHFGFYLSGKKIESNSVVEIYFMHFHGLNFKMRKRRNGKNLLRPLIVFLDVARKQMRDPN